MRSLDTNCFDNMGARHAKKTGQDPGLLTVAHSFSAKLAGNTVTQSNSYITEQSQAAISCNHTFLWSKPEAV